MKLVNEAPVAVLDDDAVAAAAQHLMALRHDRRSGARVPAACRPRAPLDGWRIQRRVDTLLCNQQGQPVVGWKCGLPPGDRWVAAALHHALPGGARVQAPSAAGAPGHGRIEPEFAFRLGRSLPLRDAPYEADEVIAAVDSVRLAIEVLGCRYDEPDAASGPELMADSLWHQALVLGPRVDALAVEPAFTLTLSFDDAAAKGEAPIDMPARHPDGDPRRALVWLAEFLRQRGLGLEAGQYVITGSLAGVLALPFGRPARLRYGSFGEIAITLDPLHSHIV